jgi:hypothetical protein
VSDDYIPTGQEIEARAEVLIAGRGVTEQFADMVKGMDAGRFYRAQAREQLIREHRLATRSAGLTRGGPPKALGPGIANVRAALEAWAADWPPTEAGFTETATGPVRGISDRRLRQILRAAGTTWQTELAAAERRRAET